jgi:hypothetical protein
MFAISCFHLETRSPNIPHHRCCCHHHHETHRSRGRKQEVEHATDSEIAELTKAVERLNERIDELGLYFTTNPALALTTDNTITAADVTLANNEQEVTDVTMQPTFDLTYENFSGGLMRSTLT